MARPISSMEQDLAVAMAAHAKAAQRSVDTVADTMVHRVRSLSAPEYGVVVSARAVEVTGGKQVQTLVRSSGGPGRVFGGQPAVQAQVAKVIDSTAKEGGLDRHR